MTIDYNVRRDTTNDGVRIAILDMDGFEVIATHNKRAGHVDMQARRKNNPFGANIRYMASGKFALCYDHVALYNKHDYDAFKNDYEKNASFCENAAETMQHISNKMMREEDL